MRHQIRAILNQLAENGRLGTPLSDDDDTVNAAAQERPKQKAPGRTASTLRKAQQASVQEQAQ